MMKYTVLFNFYRKLFGSYYYFTSWKECDMIVGNDNMAVLPNG